MVSRVGPVIPPTPPCRVWTQEVALEKYEERGGLQNQTSSGVLSVEVRTRKREGLLSSSKFVLRLSGKCSGSTSLLCG